MCDSWSVLYKLPDCNDFLFRSIYSHVPGRVAQSVTCLATDASLIADLGVASSILARSHTFVKIDHEIISTVTLLPSAEPFKKLQAKHVHKVLVNRLFKHTLEKSVVRWTDGPAMTLAVDLGCKATKTNIYYIAMPETLKLGTTWM